MYPERDFRRLLQDSTTSKEVLIRSLCREPFPEILYYWNQTGKPIELYNIYYQGIEDAVAKDRFPFYQLVNVDKYPEFYSAILNGLKRHWIKLRFSLDGFGLLIDSISGQDINISPHDKLNILYFIPYRMNINLSIDGITQSVGLFPSKHAEQIYRLNYWLTSLGNSQFF